VGELVLDCDTWISPEDPDQRILILSAEPGSPSEERLRILTSWAAGETPIDDQATIAPQRFPQ